MLKINDKKEYEIYLVGKTGERKSNIKMEVGFKHKLFIINEKSKLITDKEGKINLGPLKNVEII